MKNISPGLKTFTLLLLLVLGFYVRFADLHKHFTHIDDIGVAKIILIIKDRNYLESSPGLNKLVVNLYSAAAIPHAFTYAPLQYWITPWLINKDQTYREILFWGRLPSFVFAMLALVAIIYFFRKFRPENPFPYQLLALTILVFSWENIIYAKQMENYALGVLSAILLLLLLHNFLSRSTLKFSSLFLLAFVIAILSHAHYQILFLSPALYLTIFIFHWKRTTQKITLLRNFVLTGTAFLLMIAPMYFLYLSRYFDFGVHWNAGPGEKYMFSLAGLEGAGGKITYTIKFLFVNFFEVFRSLIAFMPEEKIPVLIVSIVFVCLMVIGFVSLLRSQGKHKYFALFIALVALTWLALIFTGKITFSPTRHSLILLPFFVLLICEGHGYLVAKLPALKNRTVALHTGSAAISLVIISCFFISFKPVMQSRSDVFDEIEILEMLEQHNTDMVVQYVYTANMFLMKDIKTRYPVITQDQWIDSIKVHNDAETIALISSRRPFPSGMLYSRGEILDKDLKNVVIDTANAEYELAFKKEIVSDVQVDFSSKTENGTNSLFLYIFKKKKG